MIFWGDQAYQWGIFRYGNFSRSASEREVRTPSVGGGGERVSSVNGDFPSGDGERDRAHFRSARPSQSISDAVLMSFFLADTTSLPAPAAGAIASSGRPASESVQRVQILWA